MKNKENIEKTLNSLDGLQPATAGDDFYEKLKSRMAKSSEKIINLRDFSWQAVAAAILILFTTNVAIILNYNSGDTSSTAGEVLANEYNLLPESNYEYITNYEEN